MSNDFMQMLVYFVILIALAIPLGRYMAKVYQGEKTWMNRVMEPLERFIYRLCGIDAQKEMNWWEYALSLLAFSFVGIVALFLLLLAQGHLPLNPQDQIRSELGYDIKTGLASPDIFHLNESSFGY